MSTVEKLKEKMKAYEEHHPDAAELFREIMGVIEDPLGLFCEEEAYFRLENLGVGNPSEERVRSLQKRLYDNEYFVDAETASNIADRVVDEMPLLLSELMKSGEEIKQVGLKTGREVQYIAVPECRTVLACLEVERQRLQDIYWEDERIAGVMGIDLSLVLKEGEDASTACGMLSDCQYCVKYDGCSEREEAKQLLEEYAELAALGK